ncbi:MAG TPA: hypothetical protein VN281_17055, partial [Verrucomicrobiae bacterium]|nr:hypothetical protein [Verrucomicrobiae bacterium]
ELVKPSREDGLPVVSKLTLAEGNYYTSTPESTDPAQPYPATAGFSSSLIKPKKSCLLPAANPIRFEIQNFKFEIERDIPPEIRLVRAELRLRELTGLKQSRP